MSTTKRAVLFLFSLDDGGRKELMRDRSRRFPEKLEIDYGTAAQIPGTGKGRFCGGKMSPRNSETKKNVHDKNFTGGRRRKSRLNGNFQRQRKRDGDRWEIYIIPHVTRHECNPTESPTVGHGSYGKCYNKRVFDVPDVRASSRGANLNEIITGRPVSFCFARPSATVYGVRILKVHLKKKFHSFEIDSMRFSMEHSKFSRCFTNPWQ